jgi:hypothetical protein
LKGILPANHSFQGGGRLMLLQIGLFRLGEETHVYLERKATELEAGASSSLFTVRIELVFERNTFCNL